MCCIQCKVTFPEVSKPGHACVDAFLRPHMTDMPHALPQQEQPLILFPALSPALTCPPFPISQELDLYKQLSHKHIVGYIDSQFEARTNTLFIFLEYVPGGSIASMVERFGRFSEELVRNYTRQLLMGLEYLHGCK